MNVDIIIFEQDLKFNFYSKGGSGGIFFPFHRKVLFASKTFLWQKLAHDSGQV